MGYRMNGFSGFGNSPAKQQDPLEKKLVSEEIDLTKNENRLDGDKTSSKDSIIKSPDKDKTRSFTEKVEAGDVTVDGKNIHQIRKEKMEADEKEWFDVIEPPSKDELFDRYQKQKRK